MQLDGRKDRERKIKNVESSTIKNISSGQSKKPRGEGFCSAFPSVGDGAGTSGNGPP